MDSDYPPSRVSRALSKDEESDSINPKEEPSPNWDMKLRSRMHPSQKGFTARTVAQTKSTSMQMSNILQDFWNDVKDVYKPFTREHICLVLGIDEEEAITDEPMERPQSSTAMDCLLSCLVVPEGDCGKRSWR